MTPSLLRRLASLLYEALLVFGVAFFAAWIFFFASGGRDATGGAPRAALQVFILAVLAAYFLWCWLRGGQTLAMRAWKIRLVDVTKAREKFGFQAKTDLREGLAKTIRWYRENLATVKK